MNKYSLDYSTLQNDLTKKKSYRLEDVKNKIKKIAWDIVKFHDPSEDIDGLWEIKHSPKGDYIVALYDDIAIPKEGSSISTVKNASTNWTVIPDSAGKNLNFFYKNAPIVRLATASLGVPESETNSIASYLPEKLASNPKLVSGLLQEVPFENRKELLTKFPELK